jgi:hypothetical protein
MDVPNRLFKYVGFTPRVLQQLCTGEVYYADPSSFNDPLDCRPSVVPDLPISELKDVLAQLIVQRVSKEVSTTMERLRFKAETIAARGESLAHQILETLVQNIKYGADHPDVADVSQHITSQLTDAIEFELRKAYGQGVLCLSTRYDSPLMWSHYADQHRGICVEFDVAKLPPGDLRKVVYGTSREIAASSIRNWLREDSAAAREQIERACLLTKSTEWDYEEEYRLLGPIGLRPSVASTRSITFGLRCDHALQYATIAALGGESSPLKFFQITSPGTHFELTRSEVCIAETLSGMPRINIMEDFELIDKELKTGQESADSA